jgi:hypothetical protein
MSPILSPRSIAVKFSSSALRLLKLLSGYKQFKISLKITDSGLEFEIIEAYVDCIGNYCKDTEELLDRVLNSYSGEFNSDEDFTQEMLEQDGSIPENLSLYIFIDWEKTAYNFMFDYSCSNGHYFRN